MPDTPDLPEAGADEPVLVLDEITLPVWEPTGEPAVDAALAALSELDSDDLAGHAVVYEQVHRQLRQVLADLER